MWYHNTMTRSNVQHNIIVLSYHNPTVSRLHDATILRYCNTIKL